MALSAAALAAAGPLANGLFGLVDRLFTTDEDRAQAKLKVLELEQSGELAQIGVNMTEAKHASVFVAGWRPFVGWIGGASLAVLVLLAVGFAFGYVPIESYQAIAGSFMTIILPLLGGMLGLRTFDKYQGTDTQFIKPVINRNANAKAK